MCGIAGWFGAAPAPALARMLDALHHRGPDDAGTWTEGAVALGHRRLSILDPSPAGHQPMASADGRWVLTYNGEVYDHEDLRGDLPGPFSSGTDTETLVEAIAAWGVEAAVRRASGMFAFAAYDRDEGALWLARDRFGKKPLYLQRSDGGDGWAFASEPKALRAGPWGADLRPDPDALLRFLHLGFVHGDASCYEDVRRLPPGHVARIDHPGAEPALLRYWSPADGARDGGVPAATPPDLDGLDAVLRVAVRQRMVADVPLGAFLSGGIDSSLVVALMQRESEAAAPVRTFSIGFEEAAFDEAPHARAVADHLGTDHTERYVTAEQALATVEDLPRVWCEPFADPSAVPTLLLCRLARRHVTVALSGDGGDEVFGGYDRYRVLLQRRRLARLLRSGGARALSRLPDALWRVPSRLAGIRIDAARWRRLSHLRGLDDADAYANLLAPWPEASTASVASVASTGSDRPRPGPLLPWSDEPGLLRRARHSDMECYLPDDILVKVDRASMSTSLEVRAPLLDHRVQAVAERFADRALMRGREGKRPLRALLARHVPRRLWDRPKQGFGIPVADWLRGPLRPWADDLLDPDVVRRVGLVDPDVVARLWRTHLGGDDHRSGALWNLLMLHAWWHAWVEP